MEEAFKAYKFDTDEEWLKVWRNVEIPPNRNSDEVMLKKKRAYYKANIDTSYNAPAPEVKKAPTPAPKPSTTTRPQPQPSRPSSTSQTATKSRFVRVDPYGANARVNPADYQALPSSISRSDSQASRAIHYVRFLILVLAMLSVFSWIFFDVFGFFSSSAEVVVNSTPISDELAQTIMPSIPGIPDIDMAEPAASAAAAVETVTSVLTKSWSDVFYSYCLYAYALLAALSIWSAFGTPQLSKQYLTNVMGSEHGMTMVSSLMLLAAPSSFLVLLPGVIMSFFPLVALARGVGTSARNVPPALAKMLAELSSHPSLAMLPNSLADVIILASRAELLVVVSQLIWLFTSRRSLLFILMLVQYLPLRYVCSPFFRMAVAWIMPYVDFVFLHPALPAIISTYYGKAKAFAWSQVDPSELQKKAAAPQKCTIM